jgi:hypothetical protein
MRRSANATLRHKWAIRDALDSIPSPTREGLRWITELLKGIRSMMRIRRLSREFLT